MPQMSPDIAQEFRDDARTLAEIEAADDRFAHVVAEYQRTGARAVAPAKISDTIVGVLGD
ncbi:MAG: hypothetical protein AAF227_10695 [Pseudomonadota bacterium]